MHNGDKDSERMRLRRRRREAASPVGTRIAVKTGDSVAKTLCDLFRAAIASLLTRADVERKSRV
jgi:hypothetical protein